MKKLLATIAVLAVSLNANAGIKEGFNEGTKDLKDAGKEIQESYKQTPNPVRPLIGTLVIAPGLAVQYAADTLDLGADAVESIVKAAVKSGHCVLNSQQPLELGGCFITLGGDAVISVVALGGYWAGSTVDYAGEAVAQYAYLMRDAANDAATWLEDNGLSPVGVPFKIIAFVMDASGKIVKVVAGTIADGIRGATEGVSMTVENVVAVPVELLKLNPEGAAKSFGVAIGSTVCTAADLLFLPVRLIIGLADGQQPKTCLQQQKESIRDGSYFKPAPVDNERVTP